MNKSLLGTVVKTAMKTVAPEPIKLIQAGNRYAKKPSALISPVTVAGHFMPRHTRAVFDMVIMIFRK